MKRQLVSCKEIALILGLSENSIRWHIRMRRINPVRLGKRLLFDPDQVVNQLNKTALQTADKLIEAHNKTCGTNGEL